MTLFTVRSRAAIRLQRVESAHLHYSAISAISGLLTSVLKLILSQVTISRNISVPSCSCSGHLGHVCNSQGKV